jgi:hypothetical protein
MDTILTTRWTLVLGIIATALFATYHYLRPRPIPGIPYNRDAAGKLFGDIPEMMGYVMRTKRIFVRGFTSEYHDLELLIQSCLTKERH